MQGPPPGDDPACTYCARSGSDLDLDLHTGGELKLHQGVHRLGVGILDVKEPAIGIEFELLAGFLVDESRTVDSEDLLVGRERDGAVDLRTGRLHGLDDLACRLVDEHVVE